MTGFWVLIITLAALQNGAIAATTMETILFAAHKAQSPVRSRAPNPVARSSVKPRSPMQSRTPFPTMVNDRRNPTHTLVVRPRFAFLHIPKTGGTAVGKALRRKCNDSFKWIQHVNLREYTLHPNNKF